MDGSYRNFSQIYKVTQYPIWRTMCKLQQPICRGRPNILSCCFRIDQAFEMRPQNLAPAPDSDQAVNSSCSAMPFLFPSPCSLIRSASILVSVIRWSLVVLLPTNQGVSVKSFFISSKGNCFVSGSMAQKKTALVKLQT